MTSIDRRLKSGIEIASAFIERELIKRQRLNPKDFNPSEVWASVTFNGHIIVGTPLLKPGSGVYVDSEGHWEFA